MDRRSLLRTGIAAGAGLATAFGGTALRAQPAFPNRPLRIFVPFAAGGPTDIMARSMSTKLGEALGQSVVVDNRPGGGAQIAAAGLKQGPADGHALLIGDIGALAINPSLYAGLSYDPLKDFAPLTMLMSAPMVLLVRADSPWRSLGDLVGAAKAGKVTMASQGIGTGGHLMLEMLKSAAAIDVAHVPYKGSAPAMQDVLAGQVDALWDVLPPALAQAQAGKVRVLVVGAPQRVPQLPEVPTAAEAGFADVRMDTWFGAVTLAGTPEPIVRRLSAEIGKAIGNPEVNKRFVDQGFRVDPGTPEQLGALMRSETERWGTVVRRAGIKVE